MRTKAYLSAPSLSVSITLCICVFIGPTLGSEKFVSVARCRAYCMNQFLSLDHEDRKCFTRNCHKCWDACYYLYDNPLAMHWKEFCQKEQICNAACQKACYFRKHMRPGRVVRKYDIHILEKISDLEKTSIEWNISARTGSPPQNIIYVIKVRDKSQTGRRGWAQHEHTTSPFIEFKTEKLFPESEIFIQAVGENGTLAEKRLTVDTMYHRSETQDRRPKLNLSVEAKTVKKRVEAVLTWQNPDVQDNVTVPYTLTWFRKECHVYEDSPYCGLPEEVFVETISGVGKRKITKTLQWLTFNTRYEIHLEAIHQEKKWFVTATFLTPFCYKVSPSFERCLQQDKVDGIPNTTVSPGLFTTSLPHASNASSVSSGSHVSRTVHFCPLFLFLLLYYVVNFHVNFF